MKKISTYKKRLLLFIDYKGITKNKFYTETGVSNGVLDKKSGLSLETVEKIISVYPELNLDWLVTGKGFMIKLAPTMEQLAPVNPAASKESTITHDSEPEEILVRSNSLNETNTDLTLHQTVTMLVHNNNLLSDSYHRLSQTNQEIIHMLLKYHCF